MGFALELMRFSGITEVEDTETSYDSIKVSMSYADSVFTVVRPDSGVVFSFAPKGEVEVFMSDAAGNFDAYTEWVFTGEIVEKDEALVFTTRNAMLVMQGHQNMCLGVPPV